MRILAATCTLAAAQTTFYAAGFDALTQMREASRSPWVIAN